MFREAAAQFKLRIKRPEKPQSIHVDETDKSGKETQNSENLTALAFKHALRFLDIGLEASKAGLIHRPKYTNPDNAPAYFDKVKSAQQAAILAEQAAQAKLKGKYDSKTGDFEVPDPADPSKTITKNLSESLPGIIDNLELTANIERIPPLSNTAAEASRNGIASSAQKALKDYTAVVEVDYEREEPLTKDGTLVMEADGKTPKTHKVKAKRSYAEYSQDTEIEAKRIHEEERKKNPNIPEWDKVGADDRDGYIFRARKQLGGKYSLKYETPAKPQTEAEKREERGRTTYEAAKAVIKATSENDAQRKSNGEKETVPERQRLGQKIRELQLMLVAARKHKTGNQDQIAALLTRSMHAYMKKYGADLHLDPTEKAKIDAIESNLTYYDQAPVNDPAKFPLRSKLQSIGLSEETISFLTSDEHIGSTTIFLANLKSALTFQEESFGSHGQDQAAYFTKAITGASTYLGGETAGVLNSIYNDGKGLGSLQELSQSAIDILGYNRLFHQNFIRRHVPFLSKAQNLRTTMQKGMESILTDAGVSPEDRKLVIPDYIPTEEEIAELKKKGNYSGILVLALLIQLAQGVLNEGVEAGGGKGGQPG